MPQDKKKDNAGGKGQKGVSTTIYLDKQVKELIDKDAEAEDRSVSYIINAILKKHYGVKGGKKRS